MSRYLFAIHEDESSYAGMTRAATADVWRAHDAFVNEIKLAGGQVLAAEALAPRSTGWWIRSDSSGEHAQTVLIDDPARGTHALGGFYVVDVSGEEQAMTLAAKCPLRNGFVEVRPIVASAAR